MFGFWGAVSWFPVLWQDVSRQADTASKEVVVRICSYFLTIINRHPLWPGSMAQDELGLCRLIA